jgi:anti-sigma B factor antagonist
VADDGEADQDDGTVVELAVHESGGVAVVVVTGEVDATTAPTLGGALDALLRTGTTRVVLDLAATGLLDSTGIGVLVRANRHLRAAGGALALAGAPRIVRRVLEVTGVDRELPCHPDVDAARAALP